MAFGKMEIAVNVRPFKYQPRKPESRAAQHFFWLTCIFPDVRARHLNTHEWLLLVNLRPLYATSTAAMRSFSYHFKICNPHLPDLTPRTQTPETLSVSLATLHSAVQNRETVEIELRKRCNLLW